MALIIIIIISMIACDYGNFQFDTIFTYISIALQLYKYSTKVIKKYKRCNKDTNDKTNLAKKID